MDAEDHQPSAPAEISLVRGGPFYRDQQAIGLIRPNQWNLGRRVAALIAIGWLPLFLITALLNPGGMHSLINRLPRPRKGTGAATINGTMAFDRKEYGVNSGIPFIKIANRVEVTVARKVTHVGGPPLVFKQ